MVAEGTGVAIEAVWSVRPAASPRMAAIGVSSVVSSRTAVATPSRYPLRGRQNIQAIEGGAQGGQEEILVHAHGADKIVDVDDLTAIISHDLVHFPGIEGLAVAELRRELMDAYL